MNKNKKLILWFKDIRIEDVGLVGGKNAALGEMYRNLTQKGVRVPNGFALTAYAYRYFLSYGKLEKSIARILSEVDTGNLKNLHNKGEEIRKLIRSTELPKDMEREISKAYSALGRLTFRNPDVAVRSSATAEDLPGASFAGQQETYLNVKGDKELFRAVRNCFASLFTDRAISYRVDKGFSHKKIALSVGVQKMVRSDLASSGVMFTLDTETGFNKVIIVSGSYGLGDNIVQGRVIPDEFIVFKPGLEQKYKSIISRKLGKKNIRLIYASSGTKNIPVSEIEQEKYCLTDREVLQLAKWGLEVEKYFSKKHKRYQPMDIEWAKDGRTNELYIVQARPETIHSAKKQNVIEEYRLQTKSKTLLTGIAVGTKIASGPVRLIKNPKEISKFHKGEILVTDMTDPDWEPIMKMASAIITDRGGRTAHAAIVSRELGIACVVGTKHATRTLKDGQKVTVDCSSGELGKVYLGKDSYQIIEHKLDKIPKLKTKIMVNVGSPQEAFSNYYLPVKGVGLGRIEFIVTEQIKIHPNVLIDYAKRKAQSTRSKTLKQLIRKIDEITAGYKDKKRFYVDTLAAGIAKIASAFWPNDVIIRFSDFKTNEYRTLLGGEFYEPKEENPMLGWRGASRYYDDKFEEAFGLECLALKKARNEFGLKNIIPMIPMCRTPEEGITVLRVMEKFGLNRKDDKTLRVYMMCEIPSNILRANEFLKLFDGMSIGSNDLTQLTLGIDRDSGIVTHIANENDASVKELISRIIHICRQKKKYIGICGQAPSDYPEFAKFLVKEGIESISLNPDSVMKTISYLAKHKNI